MRLGRFNKIVLIKEWKNPEHLLLNRGGMHQEAGCVQTAKHTLSRSLAVLTPDFGLLEL